MAASSSPLCRAHLLFFLIAFAAQRLSTSYAEIISISVVNDSRALITIASFGFTHRGHLDLAVSDASWSDAANVDPASMGFFLTTGDEWVLTSMELQTESPPCVLQTKHIKLLFTFADLKEQIELNRSFSAPDADRFTLMFANCQIDTPISMKLRASLYNLDGENGSKDYLSEGLTQLPSLYFAFFIVHIVLFIFWIYVCVKQRTTAHRIHILMGVLVFFKALFLFSEAESRAYIKRTGTPHGWDIAFYIFSFFKGVMLFTVIVLIGAGWSILKPHLHGKEKWILMIVIPLQVLANLAEVVIGENGPFYQDWLPWLQMMFLIDIICCCAVLFPIVWSIKHLRHAAQTDGKAARNLVKLTLFRQYYMVVFSYIYFTRVVVLVLRGVTSYHYTWVSVLASETATLAFYIFTGYKFKPVPHNPYFALEDEEEVASEDFKDDDFEL